jgi:8-oxo-dGTP diphosphatase
VSYTYKYPRPAVTVDCCVFGVDDDGLKLMLIKRLAPPFQDNWALPGGFVDMDETADVAARRELEEETGVKNLFLEQLYTFSGVNRDPRGRVISITYFALVKPDELVLQAGDDAKEVGWFRARKLPKLAFDHKDIVKTALARLEGKVRYQPIGFELLPRKFTLGQLQKMYQHILGRELDKRNFRRVILKMGILDALDEKQEGVSHRPSRLYRFNKSEYKRIVKDGFNFEI